MTIGTIVRRIMISIATLLVAILSIDAVCAGRVLASESKVVSSDANARFVAIGISKAIVIDLPSPIADVLVADPTIVSVVVKTAQRAYIIGLAVGQTNIYFFDGQHEQIDGVNIAVISTSQPAELANYPLPADTVEVYRSDSPSFTYSCTPIKCLLARQPGADLPPNTQTISVIGDRAAATTVPITGR